MSPFLKCPSATLAIWAWSMPANCAVILVFGGAPNSLAVGALEVVRCGAADSGAAGGSRNIDEPPDVLDGAANSLGGTPALVRGAAPNSFVLNIIDVEVVPVRDGAANSPA